MSGRLRHRLGVQDQLPAFYGVNGVNPCEQCLPTTLTGHSISSEIGWQTADFRFNSHEPRVSCQIETCAVMHALAFGWKMTPADCLTDFVGRARLNQAIGDVL
ncbi:LOW QUALITY PROTEIN: hypothetical protein CH63R_11109 [Colletotrichum higginsianum IMI 349063]|uniref:Uncharacterized protein n=1 Tax=Colletotrichum higginsianum (strain IMI 349063) TaxID=759273 RepID=A0A1B7XXB0_COLHI|nr:LOW QUALITY PROTEIN: hypothetical protein CH63R_11109 [Colletotrichum higginsianum IMI 349063]OBR04406.1 LOW QUALITY PROTEIN: hypothetical protein CH63R_11109 [Colletotrichum higginsianum IMI 349063]